MENKKEGVKIDDPVILIRISRQYRKDMNKEELYKVTRFAWVLNPKRADNAKYAFSVYKGIVIEVYEIDNWKFSIMEKRKRYEFNGRVAPDDIRAKYLDMSVAKCFKKGASNPITYINC